MNTTIKNIIFDFGGVILNIDHKKVEDAFKALGLHNFDRIFNHASQSNLFCDFEKGKISSALFRDSIRKLAGLDIPDEKLDHTWNKIICDYPAHRINLLQSVKTKYQLFLLSNTNSIHYDSYIPKFKNEFGFDFNSLFVKTYWSFKIGIRKPGKEPYDLIISENGLHPTETLFIDDSIRNITSARETKMLAYHLAYPEDLTDLFENGSLKKEIILSLK